MVQVKICGLSEETTLKIAVESGARYVGFVHYAKSPRHVSLARAAELKKRLPAHVESVLVVVDPDDALLDAIATTLAPDYIQLHGHESPARVAEIRAKYSTQKLIKAIPVWVKEDVRVAYNYDVDMLVFDAKPLTTNQQPLATLPGGNGVSFDWSLMQGFTSSLPWMLSGGLTAENVRQAIAQSGAKAVDVSSGVEREKGVKDCDKIAAFIRAAVI